MPLDWDSLKVVLAIGRTGSLARSAVLLGVDQSTAGRRLTALEADLGVSLFARSRAGLAPTDAGRIVISHAEAVERRLDRLAEDISRETGRESGLVRLVGNGWVLNRLLRRVLPGFHRRHPGIDLRLISLIPRSPARGEATVALWFESEPSPGEFAIPLGEVHYAVYAVRGADPESLPWVSFYDEDSPRRAPMRAWEKMRAGDGESLHLTSTDARDVLAAVELGIGRALLPICLAEEAGELIRIGATPVELARTMHMHVHPDTVQSRRVQALIRTLRATFAATFSRPGG